MYGCEEISILSIIIYYAMLKAMVRRGAYKIQQTMHARRAAGPAAGERSANHAGERRQGGGRGNGRVAGSGGEKSGGQRRLISDAMSLTLAVNTLHTA